MRDLFSDETAEFCSSIMRDFKCTSPRTVAFFGLAGKVNIKFETSIEDSARPRQTAYWIEDEETHALIYWR